MDAENQNGYGLNQYGYGEYGSSPPRGSKPAEIPSIIPPAGKRLFCRCCYMAGCDITWHSLAITLICLGAACLIALAAAFIPGYIMVNGYDETNCTAVRTEYTGTKKCNCGKGCSSSYPCMRIYINHEYQSQDATTQSIETVLWSDEYNLNKQCTTGPGQCHGDYNKNADSIKDYENKYGVPGKTYSCLYDPDKPENVIRKRFSSDLIIMHMMLWPSLGFLLGILISYLLYRRFGCGNMARCCIGMGKCRPWWQVDYKGKGKPMDTININDFFSNDKKSIMEVKKAKGP